MKYATEIEADAEKLLVSSIKRLRGLAFKLKFIGMGGAPDRLVLMPGGRFYFVELKGPNGRLEDTQEILFPRLEKLGCKVWILTGVQEVQRFIQHLEMPDVL
jgi:hypothetical protein